MKIVIIGAGIGGLTTAIALKQALGITPFIYEKSQQLNPIGAGLSLSYNAIKAFEKLGLSDALIQKGTPIHSLKICSQHGATLSNMTLHSGKESGVNFLGIHRHDLHALLLSKIQKDTLKLGWACTNVQLNNKSYTVHFNNGKHISADLVIACDGIHSQIRQSLLPHIQKRFANYTCWRGISSYTKTAISEAKEILGPKGRFGFLPIGTHLYWYCAISTKQTNNRTYADYTCQDLTTHFNNYSAPISDILTCTKPQDLIWNDCYDIPPLSSYAFHNILLLGDAAHAMTPNLGQGACQAIEDALYLAKYLSIYKNKDLALRKYEQYRYPRLKKIVTLSKRTGKFLQESNPILASIRNLTLKYMPQSIKRKQLKVLEHVSF